MSNIITDNRDVYVDQNESAETIETLLVEKCKKPYGTINLYLNVTTTDMIEYDMFGQLLQFIELPGYIINDKYDLDLFDGEMKTQITLKEAAEYIAAKIKKNR